MFKLNPYLHILYLHSRLKARALARLSAVKARISKGESLVTTGAYFSENVGDHMMGQVLKASFAAQGLTLFPVPYDQLKNAGQLSGVICGGGELGDQAYFNQVLASVDQAQKMSVIGTSPYAKLHNSPQSLLEQLKQVPFYCVRNKWAQKYLSELLQRTDVSYAPDLVFALPKAMPELFSNINAKHETKNLVSISVLPYGLSVLKSGEMVKDESHLTMLAELYPDMADAALQMAEKYTQYSRNLISELQARGKSVQVVSFSYGDYLFAKECYADMGITILPFSKNPVTVLKAIRASETFYTSRFHSMIFGMLARRPIVPFCYSMKCNNLLKDIFGQDCHEYIDREALLTKPTDKMHLHQLELKPFYLSEEALMALSSDTFASIERLIKSIKDQA